MFIDYLTLVLINLVAGLFIVAAYLFKGMDQEDQRPWATAFLGVGLISFITGLHISFTWPLPGAYNIAFGDTTTLFGVAIPDRLTGTLEGLEPDSRLHFRLLRWHFFIHLWTAHFQPAAHPITPGLHAWIRARRSRRYPLTAVHALVEEQQDRSHHRHAPFAGRSRHLVRHLRRLRLGSHGIIRQVGTRHVEIRHHHEECLSREGTGRFPLYFFWLHLISSIAREFEVIR